MIPTTERSRKGKSKNDQWLPGAQKEGTSDA